MGSGLFRPKNPVRGMDIAGTVTAVGEAVTEFAVGDEVVAEAGRGLAAYAVVDVSRLVRRPDGVSAEVASALPIAGTATLRGLHDLLAPGGTLVMVAGVGGKVLGPIPRTLRGPMMRKKGGRRIRPLLAMAKPETLAELLELTAEGSIAPVITRTYSFDEADQALAHIDSGRTVGKIVVGGFAG